MGSTRRLIAISRRPGLLIDPGRPPNRPYISGHIYLYILYSIHNKASIKSSRLHLNQQILEHLLQGQAQALSLPRLHIVGPHGTSQQAPTNLAESQRGGKKMERGKAYCRRSSSSRRPAAGDYLRPDRGCRRLLAAHHRADYQGGGGRQGKARGEEGKSRGGGGITRAEGKPSAGEWKWSRASRARVRIAAAVGFCVPPSIYI
jgi:hypothetical protein